MSKQIKTGLFGFGTVGQGLYEVLGNRAHNPFRIHKIVIRDETKSRPPVEPSFTANRAEVLEDTETDLLVEVIADATDALQIAKEGLAKGKSLVSANKKMIAEQLDTLLLWQAKYPGTILYEAAVCGSIPIIRLLETYYAKEPVLRLEGIFNGTTNYILSNMSRRGWDYTEALSRAQEAGFAEADPFLDVSGSDARYKLTILLLHAFGVRVPYDQIFVRGITQVNKQHIGFARLLGARVKLLAAAYQTADGVHAYVLPALVPPTHRLHGVEEEQNAVLLTTRHGSEHLFTGKGAGSLPTGLAVAADLEAFESGFSYAYHKYHHQEAVWDKKGGALVVWAGFAKTADLQLKGFDILETRVEEGYRYVRIRLEAGRLSALADLLPVNAFLAADLTLAPLPKPVSRQKEVQEVE